MAITMHGDYHARMVFQGMKVIGEPEWLKFDILSRAQEHRRVRSSASWGCHASKAPCLVSERLSHGQWSSLLHRHEAYSGKCSNGKELLIRYSSVDHIQVEDMEGIIMAPGSEAVALESILDRALPPIYLCCSTFSAKSELGSI